MPCSQVRIGGATAIICGSKRIHACCRCAGIATRECDWKLPGGKTCDRHLCEACTYEPATDKDLCPEHRQAWEQHPRNLFRDTDSTAPEGALRKQHVGMGSGAAANDHAPQQLEQQHP